MRVSLFVIVFYSWWFTDMSFLHDPMQGALALCCPEEQCYCEQPVYKNHWKKNDDELRRLNLNIQYRCKLGTIIPGRSLILSSFYLISHRFPRKLITRINTSTQWYIYFCFTWLTRHCTPLDLWIFVFALLLLLLGKFLSVGISTHCFAKTAIADAGLFYYYYYWAKRFFVMLNYHPNNRAACHFSTDKTTVNAINRYKSFIGKDTAH